GKTGLRAALPGGLVSIIETRDRIDVVGCERRYDFDTEIFDRHEFQLELVIGGLASAAVLGKPTRGLGLEFALAGIAHVATDHEAIDVLGVDAIGMTASRRQQNAQHRPSK